MENQNQIEKKKITGKRVYSDEEKEYFKKYYIDHKEAMTGRFKELYPLRKRREIVRKLNNNEYKNIPYLKIEKYNIIKDPQTKLYE